MKTSQTETRFFQRIERLKAMGLEVTIETKPADIFGECIFVSVFKDSAFASWTLRKAGGYHKRTSETTFGMINGKRVTCGEAFRRITNNY